MRKTWLFGLVLLGMAAIPAHADEWSKKYSLAGRADLRAVTNDGNIEIVGSDQKEIAVRVTTMGWRVPSDVRITESQNGNHLEIEVRVPRMRWSWFGSERRSVRVELHVPREADLDIESGDGNVSAQSVSGRIRIETGDGNMDVDGLRGDVRLHTGDGHIEGRNLNGAFDADTGDGHILLRGRFDGLNLKSGDGHIDVEVENGSKMTSAWSVRTGDGNISLRLPADFHADLDAHTGDGHISLDFPVTVSGRLSRSTIRGKLAGGGAPLTVRTGDGSIRLEKL